jgi:putative RNA 2'-phosphotransferase
MYKYENMSKFLSLLLRHHPEYLELKMDKAGWVSVDELLEKLNLERAEPFTIEHLQELVETNNKKRFALEERWGKLYIRANQGHSIHDLDMGYKPVTPPDILYHGTGEKYVSSIQKKGLLAKSRQYVHLSTSIEVAKSVGERHGKPVIFEIDCKKMANDGIEFYCADNGVWLTETVHKKYLKLLK